MIEIEPSSIDTLLKVPAEQRLDKPSVVPIGRLKFWSRRRHYDWMIQNVRFRLPLLATDLGTAFTIQILVASLLGMLGLHIAAPQQLSLLALQAFVMFLTFSAFKLYRSVGMHPVVELERVVSATAITFLTLLMIVVWRSDHDIANESLCLLITGLLCCLSLPSIRHLVRCKLGRTRWWRMPLVVIGGSDGVEALIKEIEREPHLGWKPIGFVEEFRQNWNRASESKFCLGDEEDLSDIAESESVFWGLVDNRLHPNSETQVFLDRYHHILPNLVSVVGGKGRTSFTFDIDCGGASGLCYRSSLSLYIPRLLKRLLDLSVSGLALILLSPLFLLIMLAIRLGSRGPIFYSQERIGLNASPFKIWKFRSMVPDADKVLQACLANDPKLRSEWSRTQKLTKDPRITRVGKLLRKTSLDELPQLWNVFNGSMSLVGPRPIVKSEIEKYGSVFWLYQRTKPGITGLWQVNGRNLTSYSARLEYDSFYVRNWSVWLDWYILLKTFRVVVLCEGAY
jgi:Undecaprenyl-phosphate galactose phosphotransferase WbaP